MYIIGGNNSIGSKVDNLLKKKNIEVERIEGKDRLSTSYKVSDKILELKGTSGNVLVANGFKGEADAISAPQLHLKIRYLYYLLMVQICLNLKLKEIKYLHLVQQIL